MYYFSQVLHGEPHESSYILIYANKSSYVVFIFFYLASLAILIFASQVHSHLNSCELSSYVHVGAFEMSWASQTVLADASTFEDRVGFYTPDDPTSSPDSPTILHRSIQRSANG